MEIKYGEGRPDSFSPQAVNEGVLRTAMIIPTFCYKADMGNVADIVGRFGEAVGVLGAGYNNLEAVSLETGEGSGWFAKANFAAKEAGFGYFMATGPDQWGVNLQNAYYALDLIKSDGTNDDKSLLVASTSPYDSGPLAVYSPASALTAIAMMKSNPSKYGETMQFKSSNAKIDMLRWIGAMEMGRTLATILLATHYLSIGKAIKRLINVSDYTIPAEESINKHDPNDYFAYLVRSNIEAENDILGLGNATFFAEPFFQVLMNSLVPEGGIPMCPVGLRIAQMMMVDMKIPADLQMVVDLLWFVGKKASGSQEGNIDLNLDTDYIITNDGTYDIKVVDLINMLTEFDRQIRGIKTFKGLGLKVETINFGINDMLDNRAGVKQGTIMRTILQNSWEFYEDSAVSYFRLYDSGQKKMGTNTLFHADNDPSEYILIEKNTFDADPGDDLDILYGRLFFLSLFNFMFEDGGASTANEQDVIFVQDIAWQGYLTYNDYDVSLAEAEEYVWAFANMQLPSEGQRYMDATLPYDSADQSITGTIDIGAKSYPNVTDSTFTTDEFTYDMQGGIFTYSCLSKKYLNISELVKWLTGGGCFNFGTRKDVTPDASDGKEDNPVDTPKEELEIAT